MLAFAQLSDVHVVDHQSPARVEWTDRYDDPNSSGQVPGIFASAYRPQEMLTAQVGDAMVRAINAVKTAPVTGLPLLFAIETGDNSDNCQYNEVRWNIDVLDGKRIVPDSGDLTRYEGVMDGDALYYDDHYWHPGGSPLGKAVDRYRGEYGFPTLPKLLDAARKPFTAAGLCIPWYTCFGNHDGLSQGNFPPNTVPTSTLATGGVKVISPPPGVAPADVLDPKGATLDSVLGAITVSPYAKAVTPDPNRREISRGQIVDEHFKTAGLPKGHGFTQANRDADTAYYFFDKGRFRFVVMDTVNPNGYADGSLDQAQFTWLKATIASATGKAVIVFSHHTSASMGNPFVATGGDPNPRVLGDEVTAYLLSQQRLIAWVNGHTHRNEVTAHSARRRLGRLLGDQHRLAHRLPAAVAPRRGRRQRRRHPVDLHHDPRPRRPGGPQDRPVEHGRPGQPLPRALLQRPPAQRRRHRRRQGPQHRAPGEEARRHLSLLSPWRPARGRCRACCAAARSGRRVRRGPSPRRRPRSRRR